MVYQELKVIASRANWVDLGRAAEAVYKDENRTPMERAFARVLWGYALLRLDPHRYLDRALTTGSEGYTALAAGRDSERDAVDYATTVYGGSLQCVGDHQEAERIFRELLEKPDVDITYRLIAVANLAHSLNCLGKKSEALKVFHAAGAEIDAVPQDQWKPMVFRERQRLRLNLADYYLSIPNPAKAEAELNAVDHRDITQLMSVSYMVSRARLAVLRDDWVAAEELGMRAHAGANQAGYTPLRIDALGVLVAVASRRGRYLEQQRLVVEMAQLSAPGK